MSCPSYLELIQFLWIDICYLVKFLHLMVQAYYINFYQKHKQLFN